jgi:hypothetical protein
MRVVGTLNACICSEYKRSSECSVNTVYSEIQHLRKYGTDPLRALFPPGSSLGPSAGDACSLARRAPATLGAAACSRGMSALAGRQGSPAVAPSSSRGDWSMRGWRHARAWLMLCERAKVRVQHRRAVSRGRVSVVLSGATVFTIFTICCLEPLYSYICAAAPRALLLRNHLKLAHPTLHDSMLNCAR